MLIIIPEEEEDEEEERKNPMSMAWPSTRGTNSAGTDSQLSSIEYLSMPSSSPKGKYSASTVRALRERCAPNGISAHNRTNGYSTHADGKHDDHDHDDDDDEDGLHDGTWISKGDAAIIIPFKSYNASH